MLLKYLRTLRDPEFRVKAIYADVPRPLSPPPLHPGGNFIITMKQLGYFWLKFVPEDYGQGSYRQEYLCAHPSRHIQSKSRKKTFYFPRMFENTRSLSCDIALSEQVDGNVSCVQGISTICRKILYHGSFL